MRTGDRRGEGGEIYRRRVAMAALEVMAEAFAVPLSRLTMASRQRANVAFARQMAMYLAHVVGGLSLREVAAEFEREPSTVSHACHMIEDRREEGGVFDAQMLFLERALRERMEAFSGAIPGPCGKPAPPEKKSVKWPY